MMGTKFFKTSSVILLLIFQTVYCKPEWYEAKDGTRFLIENQEEYNWYDAFYECASRNLKLLAIQSEEKNNALKEVLLVNFGDAAKINHLWIGGYDKFNENLERPFYWIDDDITTGKLFAYTFWALDQPDNYDRKEHCVHVRGHEVTFLWNDYPCNKQEFGFICEEKDLKYAKEKTQNDDEHPDKEEQSNQHDNIVFTGSDDTKTADSIDQDLKYSKEEAQNDNEHPDKEEQSNQHDNIVIKHSDDTKTADPIYQVVYIIPENIDWIKSLQNTEVDILDISSNGKTFRVIKYKRSGETV